MEKFRAYPLHSLHRLRDLHPQASWLRDQPLGGAATNI
jgi:hypothetical protein